MLLSACSDSSESENYISLETPEQTTESQEQIDDAVLGPESENLLIVYEAIASKTGIDFSLKNPSDIYYHYGYDYVLAHYADGRWRPVPFLPSDNVRSDVGFVLAGGETKQYSIDWYLFFGELPPGRYMFIRGYTPSGYYYPYSLGVREYIVIEFTVNA